MSKRKEGKIKTLLCKEAQARREHQKQTFVSGFLLHDAETRIASVLKEAMPRGASQSNLRNSAWNTVWDWHFPGARVKQIQTEIENRFDPYFYKILEGRHRAVKPGIEPIDPTMPGFTVSKDAKAENEEVEDGSIYFRFSYYRKLGPQQSNKNQSQQSAYESSNNAIDVLDGIFPGFSEFKSAVESNNIPSQPYFHGSDFDAKDGGLVKSKEESFFNFIRSERERHKKGIQGSRTHNYYRQHEEMLNQTGKLITSQRQPKRRTFSNQNIPRDATFRDLFEAILLKSKDGYSLDTRGLTKVMAGMVRRKMDLYNLDPLSQDKKTQDYIKTYKYYYFTLFKSIVKWFEEFEQNGTYPTKNEVTLEELRLALAHLTIRTSSGKHSLNPDEFGITIRTPYYSNGWDSTPNDPRKAMLTLAPVRQLPDGEVRYDRGNGNMGYDHLTSNWKLPSKRVPKGQVAEDLGVEAFLNRWGPECVKWYEQLSKGRVNSALSTESREAFDAAQNVFNNRTGAENVLDLLTKYPNWNEFKENHLDKSFYSEIRTVNGGLKALQKEGQSGNPVYRHNFPIDALHNQGAVLNQIDQYGAYMKSVSRDNPEAAGYVFDSLNKNLIELYSKQELDWDTLTLALKKLNDYVNGTEIKLNPNDSAVAKNWVGKKSRKAKGEGEDEEEVEEDNTAFKMDAQGFENFKKYGYQTAKMMDFLSAIMTRSCKEEIEQDGNIETVYGHQISGSSGKSRGGEIILSVRYAYNAPQLTNDPQIRKEINKEQRARHVRAKSRLQPQTAHPQQAEPTGRFTKKDDPSTEVGIFEPFRGETNPLGSIDNSNLNDPDLQEPDLNAPIVTIVENIEYFLGQAAGKRRFAKTIRHGLPWRHMIDQFMTMYPDVGEQLGVIFEPMNADLQRLELSCKRAIEKVRKGVEVRYLNNARKLEHLSGDTLRDRDVVTGGADPDAAAPIDEIQGQDQPQPQAPDQTPAQTQPQSWNKIYPEFPAPKFSDPDAVPVQDQSSYDETSEKKPMPTVNFVGKTKNQDRKLIRSISYTLGSIQDRLINSANRLDEIGEKKMADKVDVLLSKIQEDEL